MFHTRSPTCHPLHWSRNWARKPRPYGDHPPIPQYRSPGDKGNHPSAPLRTGKGLPLRDLPQHPNTHTLPTPGIIANAL
ncbi:hypothetical protein, partial [Leptolyngbya sp. PCC 6406]|uniref:hypothetical protein n=1 Tax=Leptolyngbya sp. PCC 6406 TaxID=1173264 RepID=UPI001CECFB84